MLASPKQGLYRAHLCYTIQVPLKKKYKGALNTHYECGRGSHSTHGVAPLWAVLTAGERREERETLKVRAIQRVGTHPCQCWLKQTCGSEVGLHTRKAAAKYLNGIGIITLLSMHSRVELITVGLLGSFIRLRGKKDLNQSKN